MKIFDLNKKIEKLTEMIEFNTQNPMILWFWKKFFLNTILQIIQ